MVVCACVRGEEGAGLCHREVKTPVQCPQPPKDPEEEKKAMRRTRSQREVDGEGIS